MVMPTCSASSVTLIFVCRKPMFRSFKPGSQLFKCLVAVLFLRASRVHAELPLPHAIEALRWARRLIRHDDFSARACAHG